MAQAVEYAKILSEYLVAHHEVGETIPLTGDKITEIISKETNKDVKLYSNAFVEIRRALVFQPIGDKALIPTRRDIDNIKSPVGYKLINKKEFDSSKLDGSMVIGMDTSLVQNIVSKARQAYGKKAEDITFLMRLLMTADVLYRQGTDKRFEMIPLRPISISIMLDRKEVLDYYVKPLSELGFIELSSTEGHTSNHVMNMYRLVVTEGWRPISKSVSRSQKSLRLEQFLKAKEESAKPEVVTPIISPPKGIVTFSSVIGEEDSQAINDFSSTLMKDLSRFLKERFEKRDSEKNMEIQMLREELRIRKEDIAELKDEVKRLKENQLNEEAIMASDTYKALLSRSNKILRERDEAQERYKKRYKDEKDLSEAKSVTLDRLDSVLAKLKTDMERDVDDANVGEVTANKLKFKLAKTIMGSSNSLESVFRSKN